MMRSLGQGLILAVALVAGAGAVSADEERGAHEGGARPQQQRGGESRASPIHEQRAAEPHAGPTHYQRVSEPKGWNARPATVDRSSYQHNFQAARSFRIGPYHHPQGWTARTWGYGQVLPRAYWAAPYILADYWLFALEVPPSGCEWVREGNDALLVSTVNGEILQAEYGVFG